MTTPTPKPCPFCGHPEPTVMHDCPTLPRGYSTSWVWCEACNATGPEEATGEAEAVQRWNRAPRPESAAAEARRRSHAVRDRRRLRRALRGGR